MAAGEFVALLDHDDELAPHALYAVAARLDREPETDLVYSDEDKVDGHGRRFQPAFKPDWSPDLFRSMNYLGHLCVVRTALARKVGGFRPGFDGSQDYDLLLRVAEATQRIAHVPDVLYSWRTVAGSAAGSLTAKPYAYQAAARALQESLDRQGVAGHVEPVAPGRYTVRYRVEGAPLVSVVVPARAGDSPLRRCLGTLQQKTAYSRYEVLLVESGEGTAASRLPDALRDRVRGRRYEGPGNAAAVLNAGAAGAGGDYLLFLHDDIEIVSPEWMTALLEHAQRPSVGAVGGRLLYPDGRLQQAGLFLRDVPGDVAGYRFRGLPAGKPGYLGLPGVTANVSAMSAACLMVRRHDFEALGGFDEAFRDGLGDLDLCLRLREQGRLVVYTPLATLYHHAAAPEGPPTPGAATQLFRRRWPAFFEGRRDPYWNPNLSVEREGVELAL
jgi:GT2 family glycosyltransferase